MRKYSKHSGMSLMEVVVASAITGLMIVGILSSQGAMQSSTQGFGKGYVSSGGVVSTLNHILNNASLAIGSGNDPAVGKGILTNQDIATLAVGSGRYSRSRPTFCIHQDTADSMPTPGDESDDRWICYTQIQYTLYLCSFPYVSGGSRGVGSCSAENSTRIGSLNPYTITDSNPTFTVSNSQGAQKALFSITIISKIDPSQQADANNNPESVRTGSVSPPGHSI